MFFLLISSCLLFNLESGEQMLIDIDSKSRDEVLAHLLQVIGKSEYVIVFFKIKFKNW